MNKHNRVKAWSTLDYCDSLFLSHTIRGHTLTVRLEKEEAVFYVTKMENFEVRVQMFGCSFDCQTTMIDIYIAGN